MHLNLLTSLFFSLALWIFNPVPEAEKGTADILFAGDAMCHSAQLSAAKKGNGYSFEGYYDGIAKAVNAADFAVVNLETPVSGGSFSGYPCFNAPDSFAEELKKAGFDLLLTANNHTLDRRVGGGRKTLRTLDTLGIEHIGTYSDKESRSESIPFIKDINGIKTGFLNYTYGTNGFVTSDGFIVDYIDKDKIRNDVEKTRSAGAELIVVAIHWGTEYILLPDKSQKDMASFLRSLGVEMIIGGHPHVVQPMELENGRLTVYSLGNLVSNMKTTDTRGGALLRVTIGRNESGKAIVKDAAYSLVFVEPPSGISENYRVTPCEKVKDMNSGYKCRQFLASTGKSLDRHNKNVPRIETDSLIQGKAVPGYPSFVLPHFSPFVK